MKNAYRTLMFIVALLLCASTTAPHSRGLDPVYKTVAPREIHEPIDNPYMGWGIWTGLRYFDGTEYPVEYSTIGFGDDALLFSNVMIDWMWADLEAEEGAYEWEDLDTLVTYWGKRGKQILMRLWVTDDPGWNGAPGNTVMPDWVWAAGVKFREYTGEGRSSKREPDYAHPSFEKIFLPKLRKTLTALARRYEKPGTPITFYQVMGYGQWGEWHTLWSHYPWPSREVKHDVLTKIINTYLDVFSADKLAIAYVFDNDREEVDSLEEFLYRQALDLAASKGFALTRHGFIDGLLKWDRWVMEAYWHKNPMIAEGNWSYTDIKNHGTHGTFDQNLDVMLEWHSHYASFYLDSESYKRVMKEDRRTIERGLKAGGLGYRLLPTSVSWKAKLRAGDQLVLKQEWVNRNVGLCPKQFPLCVYLIDPRGREAFSGIDRCFDPRKWVKGATHRVTSLMRLPKDITPGTYALRIALVDETGKPAIKLAIAGADKNLRYTLGELHILPPSHKHKDEP